MKKIRRGRMAKSPAKPQKLSREMQGLKSDLSPKMKTKAVATENEKVSRSGRHQVNRDLPDSIPSDVAKFVTKGSPSSSKNRKSPKTDAADLNKSVSVPANGIFPAFVVVDKSLLNFPTDDYKMKLCTVPVKTCDTERLIQSMENDKTSEIPVTLEALEILIDEDASSKDPIALNVEKAAMKDPENLEAILGNPEAEATESIAKEETIAKSTSPPLKTKARRGRKPRGTATKPSKLIKSAPELEKTSLQPKNEEPVNAPITLTNITEEEQKLELPPEIPVAMDTLDEESKKPAFKKVEMPSIINSSSPEWRSIEESRKVKEAKILQEAVDKEAENKENVDENNENLTDEPQIEETKDIQQSTESQTNLAIKVEASPNAIRTKTDYQSLIDDLADPELPQVQENANIQETPGTSVVIKEEALDADEAMEGDQETESKWHEGQLVWSAFGSGFWPSIVVKSQDGVLEHINKKGTLYMLVKYLNDTRFGECPLKTAVSYCSLEELAKLCKKKPKMSVGYKRAIHAASFFEKVPVKDRIKLYDAITNQNRIRAKRVLSVDSGIKSDNEVNENKDINEFGNFKSGTSIESMMSKYYEAMDDFDKSVNQNLKESAKRLFSPMNKLIKQEFTPVSRSINGRRLSRPNRFEQPDDTGSVYSGVSETNETSNSNRLNDAVNIKIEKIDTPPPTSKRVRKPNTKHIVGEEDNPPPAKKSKIVKQEETLEQLYICKHAESLKIFDGVSKMKVCVYCFNRGELFKCEGNCGKLLHKQCCVIEPGGPMICNECKIEDRQKCFCCEAKPPIVFKTKEQEKDKKVVVKSEPTETLSDDHEMSDSRSSTPMEAGPSSSVNFPPHRDSQKPPEDLAPGSLVCTRKRCGLIYHSDCLKKWRQAMNIDTPSTFICPAHNCHTCATKNEDKKEGILMNCIYCPAVYHSNLACIPAATKLLSTTQVICARHLNIKTTTVKPSKPGKLGKRAAQRNRTADIHINVNWCSYCSIGGDLICCDGCPKAFHKDCLLNDLPKTVLDDDSFMCFECEGGRMPVYNELVWAKIGAYRWWPCQVMPSEVAAENMLALRNNHQQFCVRFFGTRDYAWMTYFQVFKYDSVESLGAVSTSSQLDHAFKLALTEAKAVNDMLKQDKLQHNTDKPNKFQKIKQNMPVLPLKLSENEKDEDNICICKSDDPCTEASGCINRAVFYECNRLCPSGDLCQNKRLKQRKYAETKVMKTLDRGWGLIAMADIEKDDLVIEYVGELINDKERSRRMAEKLKNNSKNYYFLNIEPGITIDAELKANNARFMNHSCLPNCQPSKWKVNGLTRIGLMASRKILKDEELTFNYSWQSEQVDGGTKTACHCGAPNCTKFFGSKAVKQKVKEIKVKKVTKPKRRAKKVVAVVKHITGECSDPEELVVDE